MMKLGVMKITKDYEGGAVWLRMKKRNPKRVKIGLYSEKGGLRQKGKVGRVWRRRRRRGRRM